MRNAFKHLLIRIKNRDYMECEFEMKAFLERERDKIMSRFRKKEPRKAAVQCVYIGVVGLYSV